jgi:hypothetical protein
VARLIEKLRGQGSANRVPGLQGAGPTGCRASRVPGQRGAEARRPSRQSGSTLTPARRSPPPRGVLTRARLARAVTLVGPGASARDTPPDPCQLRVESSHDSGERCKGHRAPGVHLVGGAACTNRLGGPAREAANPGRRVHLSRGTNR